MYFMQQMITAKVIFYMLQLSCKVVAIASSTRIDDCQDFVIDFFFFFLDRCMPKSLECQANAHLTF